MARLKRARQEIGFTLRTSWITGQTFSVILLFFLGTSLVGSARELIPEDDGPEQQEEVVPLMPTEISPGQPQAGASQGLSPGAPAATTPGTQAQPQPMTPLPPPSVKWEAPNFANQTQAMGWTPETFKVPKGMEDRVKFWRDIYTKYTSRQGVIHDSLYVNVIYEEVNFGDVNSQRERRKIVKQKKKEIIERLKRLQTLKDGDGLTGEDLRYWNLFSAIGESKKFSEATGRRRLRFQLGQRDQFLAGVQQSGRYLRQMEEVFRQEGMPIELTRLPFVESSFNPQARSRVGATGLWQFMRSAARGYLRMDASADERNDPLRATRAAALKLKDNFELLKSWPLAVTAYNRGPAGVKRLTEKMGSTDLMDLIDVRKGRFGFASANFYASFLAALEVERNVDNYFGSVNVVPELRGVEIQLEKSQPLKALMKWFGDDTGLAQTLNPHINPVVWKGRLPLSRKHILRVPLLQEARARSELE